MERIEAAHEYQDLRDAVGQRPIPEIDVADKVMSRISSKASGLRRFTLGRTMRSSTALASLFALLLVVSVTAYATSEYIQIRNKSGEVKVQFVPPDTVRIMDNLYEKYLAEARKFAEPGDLIALYAKDGADLPLGPMQFHYETKSVPSYADFAAELERVGAREVPQILDGYTFEYGGVSPAIPEKGTKQYQDTLKELERLALQSSDKENVVMKAIPWSNASGVSAIYSKDGTRIGIYATFLNGMEVRVTKSEDNTTEKIEVAGTEVVYNDVEKVIAAAKTLNYGYLNWYDEDQDAYYTLTNFKGAKLSKEQLLELAREWIEKKG